MKDSEEEEEFVIEEIIVHENYTINRFENDIALLQIKPKEKREGTSIRFGSMVQPLCLPSSDFQHKAGIDCTISGWGRMSNHPNATSGMQSIISPSNIVNLIK